MSFEKFIEELKTNTEHFLRNNYVSISGGDPKVISDAGKAYFKMERIGETPGLRISKLKSKEDGPDVFEAWYIPMQQLQKTANGCTFTARKLPTTPQESPGIMLTSQLTGCMFAVGSDGSSTTVAHIQPNQGADTNLIHAFGPPGKGEADNRRGAQATSDLRQSDMRMAVRAQGMKTAVAVAGYYADKAASVAYDRPGKGEAVAIVGIRDDKGHWGIFAQINANKTIKDVKRL